jgi:hypothetical protein
MDLYQEAVKKGVGKIRVNFTESALSDLDWDAGDRPNGLFYPEGSEEIYMFDGPNFMKILESTTAEEAVSYCYRVEDIQVPDSLEPLSDTNNFTIEKGE